MEQFFPRTCTISISHGATVDVTVAIVNVAVATVIVVIATVNVTVAKLMLL
jgi:hypothetical protein